MLTQEDIDQMSDALRAQGLTWNQTNFAVSLVRNSVDAESKACASAIRAAALESDDEAEAHGMRFAAGILDKRSNAQVTGASPALMAKRPVD